MTDPGVADDLNGEPEILVPPIIFRIRRNHGLEHATLHVLARHFPHRPMAGYSDAGGFWILGEVPTETLADAVNEALQRIKAGERYLVLHPNCGTNLLTAGTLAGLAATTALVGVGERKRDKLERLPLAIILAILGLILAQPLGALLQARVTTTSDPGPLRSLEITCKQQGRLTIHRVKIWG